jgi:gluconolactonase
VIPLLLAVTSLYAQDFSQAQIERVSGNHQFTEGPVWGREGYLLFSDVPENKIYKIDPKGKSVARENSNGANGNTFDAQGRLLTCESRTRRVVRQEKSGAITVIAEQYQGKRLNAPNDIVVRKDGHIYFTDPAFGNQEQGRELDFFGVYHIPPKGEMELVAKPAGRPNGIALSPNGRILYVANSDEKNVRAYDLDGKGAASNERVVVANIDGVPDGMKVDEKGNLYVTARAVFVYNPAGKQIAKLETPETPTNVAFGDSDFMTLYITARSTVYRTRLPLKGSAQYPVE